MTSTAQNGLELTQAMVDTPVVAQAARIVVKVGSALVTNEGRGLDPQAISRWAA